MQPHPTSDVRSTVDPYSKKVLEYSAAVLHSKFFRLYQSSNCEESEWETLQACLGSIVKDGMATKECLEGTRKELRRAQQEIEDLKRQLAEGSGDNRPEDDVQSSTCAFEPETIDEVAAPVDRIRTLATLRRASLISKSTMKSNPERKRENVPGSPQSVVPSMDGERSPSSVRPELSKATRRSMPSDASANKSKHPQFLGRNRQFVLQKIRDVTKHHHKAKRDTNDPSEEMKSERFLPTTVYLSSEHDKFAMRQGHRSSSRRHTNLSQTWHGNGSTQQPQYRRKKSRNQDRAELATLLGNLSEVPSLNEPNYLLERDSLFSFDDDELTMVSLGNRSRIHRHFHDEDEAM